MLRACVLIVGTATFVSAAWGGSAPDEAAPAPAALTSLISPDEREDLGELIPPGPALVSIPSSPR